MPVLRTRGVKSPAALNTFVLTFVQFLSEAYGGLEDAKQIILTLRKAGHQGYLVGGGVRDMLLGRKPKDYDVATNATPAINRAVHLGTKAVLRGYCPMNRNDFSLLLPRPPRFAFKPPQSLLKMH